MVYHKVDLFKGVQERLKNTRLVPKIVTEHSPTDMNFQKHHTQQADTKLGRKAPAHFSEMLSFQSYQNPDLSAPQTSEHCCQGRPLLGDLSITAFYV